MADSSSFRAARQQLENEMTDRQSRLISILTGRLRGSAAEKELLESEIEDRNFAIQKLEAQTGCDTCGTQVDVPGTFRVRITKYSAMVLSIHLPMEKVHVRAECADCSGKYDWLPESERILAANDGIVRDEIERLQSSPQWQDLKNCAYRRAQCFPANLGKTGEDLFQEALVSTLEGRKKWKMTAVDIFGHLLFAMKNIAYGWEENFYRWESTVESVTHNAEGDELSRLDNEPSSVPSVDECVSTRDEVERLFGKFREDKVATAILQAKKEGLTTAREIMQEHNLTKRQYTAGWRRIHARKSILIIEEDYQVRELFVRLMMAMDFAVVTASTANESLSLYREFGPFNVVMMSYSIGVELAMNIRKRCPSPNMIITTTYPSEEDVVRPSELGNVPILLKPFPATALRTVIESFANSVKEQPANRCRQKRRRGMTGGNKRRLLQTVSASKPPKQAEALNATPPS